MAVLDTLRRHEKQIRLAGDFSNAPEEIVENDVLVIWVLPDENLGAQSSSSRSNKIYSFG
jgi:hypothetical protein